MIVVTAPTGTIGRQVVDDLLARAARVRVIVRDPDRLAGPVRERVEVVAGSHSDPDVVAQAFAGAEAVFWLVPPDRQALEVLDTYVEFSRPGVKAFVEQGVRRVVGISALGRTSPLAGRAGLVTASLAMDDLIAASGVPYRALALPSFMDNVLRQVPAIRDQGRYYGPSDPDRKMPAVATRDIAAAATRLLLDDSWTGSGGVPVLGPQDLSLHEEVRIMSEVLGRPIEYVRTPPEAFKAQLLAGGASESMAQAMVDMSQAKDAGLDEGVARTPETASPTSFRQWCEEVLKPAVDAA
jgi:uncharacterized protein YbjT (DUF2867 family)